MQLPRVSLAHPMSLLRLGGRTTWLVAPGAPAEAT